LTACRISNITLADRGTIGILKGAYAFAQILQGDYVAFCFKLEFF
jgi:hypothetical protein